MLFLASPVGAEDGDPLRNHSRDLDVFHGPVIASGRITSLGGAYVGIAEGVDGVFFNPAAVANRYAYSLDWWDWDLDVGILFPTSFGGLDSDNDGEVERRAQYAAAGTVGGALQLGRFGFGFEASLLQTKITSRDGPSAAADLAAIHMDLAYGFFGGQWIVGLGARAAIFSVTQVGEISGFNAEGGVLWRPNGLSLRLGVAGRLPVESDRNSLLERVAEADGPDGPSDPCQSTRPIPDSGLFVPCRLIVPWEVSVGASYRLGPRSENVPWLNPHAFRDAVRARHEAEREARARQDAEGLAQVRRELRPAEEKRLAREWRQLVSRQAVEEERLMRLEEHRREADYAARPRLHLLLTTSLTITGPAPNALGLHAFLRQVERRSGRQTSLTPALGAESEVWSNRLKLRLGSYLEPTRFERSVSHAAPRLHGTSGLDLRLFEWNAFGLVEPFSFKATGMVDLAREYLNFSVGLGVWH